MSVTLDNVIRDLDKDYWSTERDGRAVFPLRAKGNGFPPPGEYLAAFEDDPSHPGRIGFAIFKASRKVDESSKFADLDEAVEWARCALKSCGVERVKKEYRQNA